jgi:LPXTG-motif cell wall-anchored protein
MIRVSRSVSILSVIMVMAVTVIATVAVAFATQNGGGAGQEKVTICHKGKNTITVGAPARDAHLRHGDKEGPCSTTPETTVPEETTVPGQDKVTLCHEGTNTITVSASAQGAHLDHGDIVGTCEESGVIDKTIPKNKLLPNTGGSAILAPAAGLLLLSTAVLGLLRVRRR